MHPESFSDGGEPITAAEKKRYEKWLRVELTAFEETSIKSYWADTYQWRYNIRQRISIDMSYIHWMLTKHKKLPDPISSLLSRSLY